LQQAEEILDTAVCADRNAAVVILVDCQGGMRVLDPAGWTVAALKAEFAADMVFKIVTSAELTSVEAWGGHDHCVVERHSVPAPAPWLTLMPAVCHPMRFHNAPLFIAASDMTDSSI